MRGIQKNTGFLIDIYPLPNELGDLIKNSDMLIHSRGLKYADYNDLAKILRTLNNPSNKSSGKIKFIVVKITEWTLLNAILSNKTNLFKDFFSALRNYPHEIYIYEKNFRNDFSIIKNIVPLMFPIKFHIADLLTNYKEYNVPEEEKSRSFDFDTKNTSNNKFTDIDPSEDNLAPF
jgi:hypothetical protein